MNKYSAKLSEAQKLEILEKSKSLTAPELAKEYGLAPASIRRFLKVQNIIPIKISRIKDRSVKCKICNIIFTPKHYSHKNRQYSVCSEPCRRVAISKGKTKYTQEDIDKVIALKKDSSTIDSIVKATNLNINTVKAICKKYNVYLIEKQRQLNAFNGKIEKNPNAYKEMRDKYSNKVKSLKNLEIVKLKIESLGWEYVSGFKGTTKPFEIMCKKCKNLRNARSLHTITNACSFCSNTGISKVENEVAKWLLDLGYKTEKYKFSYREGGKEIDIYLPEYRLGIEYCGLYWHNEDSPWPRGPEHHLTKLKKAEEENIRLLTIFGDEWAERKIQVQNYIKSCLGNYSTILGARKCFVEKITIQEGDNFMEKNHIQGSSYAEVYFGLKSKNGELVGAISGGKHHRGTGDFVLNRLAFKANTRIQGGASKLILALKGWAIDNNYFKIITWSDKRWSQGQVYKANGFTLAGTLAPDYSYVCGNRRLPKQSCTKKALLLKGGVGNTEKAMAKSLKYSRIWDCGKVRWEIELR